MEDEVAKNAFRIRQAYLDPLHIVQAKILAHLRTKPSLTKDTIVQEPAFPLFLDTVGGIVKGMNTMG